MNMFFVCALACVVGGLFLALAIEMAVMFGDSIGIIGHSLGDRMMNASMGFLSGGVCFGILFGAIGFVAKAFG